MVAFDRQSVSATGRGRGPPELKPLKTKITSTLGVVGVRGIVPRKEGDTDFLEATGEPGKVNVFLITWLCKTT